MRKRKEVLLFGKTRTYPVGRAQTRSSPHKRNRDSTLPGQQHTPHYGFVRKPIVRRRYKVNSDGTLHKMLLLGLHGERRRDEEQDCETRVEVLLPRWPSKIL